MSIWKFSCLIIIIIIIMIITIAIIIIIIFININIVFVVMCYKSPVNEEPCTSPGTVCDWPKKKIDDLMNTIPPNPDIDRS
mgnify:CR=1 FL=1